jgi:hypothetical protein
MVLRELHEDEKNELARIKILNADYTWQILLGIIAIDILDDKSLERPVIYAQLVDCISDDYLSNLDIQYRKGEIPTLPPILFNWLGKMIKEQKIEKNNRVRNNALAVAFGLMDAVCGISCGMTGKKQMDMWKFYEEVNKQLKQETGHEMDELVEETYRYIVTCLEYVGFNRNPSKSETIIDVSKITWNNIHD